MKNVKTIASGILATTIVLSSNLAMAQNGGFAEWKEGNFKTQSSAFFDIVFIVALIAGIIFLVGALFSWWLLSNDKAPQALQQTGMKAVWTSMGIGVCLIALSWFVDFATATVIGGEKDNDTWDKLRSGQIEYRMPERVA